MRLTPSFGEILFADLPFDGSVQGGIRPVLVVQNNIGNRHAPTVEILPLSSRVTKCSHLPTHVFISPDENNGLARDSIILAENVRTIPIERLLKSVGTIDDGIMVQVAKARLIQSPLPYFSAEPNVGSNQSTDVV